MGRYLWCEDSASGYQFWCFLCKFLYPDVIVESKKNNTRLRKAASQIQNDGNDYYLLIDNALDNPDVSREIKILKRDTSAKPNVHIMEIHSFEYALLSFELLEQWVFAEKDPLKEQRRNLIENSKLFVKMNSKIRPAEDQIKLFENEEEYKDKMSEQIAAKLLFAITRNTGFETDKGHLGECFVVNCCEWNSRQSDDICGLDNNRITDAEKAGLLVERSILKQVFERLEA